MVPVDEGKVESSALAHEPRQGDLRPLGVELHHVLQPCLLQDLQAAVGEPRRLIGIEHHVSRFRIGIEEEAFADEQR